jgi:hypothetical protein
MKIPSKKSKNVPSLSFNDLFIESFTINQTMTKDDTKEPEYNLSIIYRDYAIDANGLRHFNIHNTTIQDKDYTRKVSKNDINKMVNEITKVLDKLLDD